MADDTAEATAAALEAAGGTVAVAETCTGGLVAARLTAVPGASDYVERAWVPYAYDALRTELGVEREALDEHGAVSAPVTRQLARRARDRADADWGVATTGVAGPSGGSEETPVGTVFVGLSHAAPWGSEDSFARVTAHDFDGDREAVRAAAAETAVGALGDAVRTASGGGGEDGEGGREG